MTRKKMKCSSGLQLSRQIIVFIDPNSVYGLTCLGNLYFGFQLHSSYDFVCNIDAFEKEKLFFSNMFDWSTASDEEYSKNVPQS